MKINNSLRKSEKVGLHFKSRIAQLFHIFYLFHNEKHKGWHFTQNIFNHCRHLSDEVAFDLTFMFIPLRLERIRNETDKLPVQVFIKK